MKIKIGYNQQGQIAFTMDRATIESLVDIRNFESWCYNVHLMNIQNWAHIPLELYLEYYDYRSKKLAAANSLSKGITNASKDKIERLTNDAEYRKQQAEKWAAYD